MFLLIPREPALESSRLDTSTSMLDGTSRDYSAFFRRGRHDSPRHLGNPANEDDIIEVVHGWKYTGIMYML
jgi:hypothetical protein